MKTKDTVKKLDKGLRHKNGVKQEDFVAHYTKVFAKHAYATHDGSWNEFEKTTTHVLGMLMYYQRFCELMGFPGEDGDSFDPRNFVWDFEDRQEEMDKLAKGQASLLMENVLLSVGVK